MPPPEPTAHRQTRAGLREALGHAAVWPGLYASATLLLLYDLIGSIPASGTAWHACVFAFLCAQAGYLLDRAKLTDRRLDPADAQANRSRHGFITSRSRTLRILISLELGLAALLGGLLDPLLASIPLGVAIGIIWYAGRPADIETPRPKDRSLLKSPMIAAAHLALAASIATFTAPMLPDTASLLVAGGAIWLVVLGDAILCDLDDAQTDASFGTRSLPVVLGAHRAWLVALACYAAATLLVSRNGDVRVGLVLGAGLAGSAWIASRLTRRKDFVDARLILLAWAMMLVQ